MDITGKILRIENTETVGANNFEKRKIYLDRTRKEQYSDREFPNFAEITLLGERTKFPEQIALQPGDVAKFYIDVNGRFFQHEGKELFAQELVAWKIEKRTATNQNPNQNVQPTQPQEDVYGRQA